MDTKSTFLMVNLVGKLAFLAFLFSWWCSSATVSAFSSRDFASTKRFSKSALEMAVSSSSLRKLSVPSSSSSLRAENEAFFAEEPLGEQEVTAPFVTQNTTSVVTGNDSAAMSDLKQLAKESNPVVGFYDPINLAELEFYELDEAGSIGFLRHAEIKHGRVAMAAFVGYCVQSNWHFPWKMTLAGDDWPSTDLSPEAQWDIIPLGAKYQIFLVIALLEIWDEIGGGIGEDEPGLPHYSKGRMPGQYPSFQQFRDKVHWTLDLYDPFKRNKKMSEEKKAKRRIMEINNGRLAMIGIMGFLAADAVPGSVPLLNDIAKFYEGNVMVPFSNDFSFYGEVVKTVASTDTPSLTTAVATMATSVSESVDIPVVTEVAKQVVEEASSFTPQLLN